MTILRSPPFTENQQEQKSYRNQRNKIAVCGEERIKLKRRKEKEEEIGKTNPTDIRKAMGFGRWREKPSFYNGIPNLKGHRGGSEEGQK